MSGGKTLFVKRTNYEIVSNNWGIKLPTNYQIGDIYVKCNSTGIINWETCFIYKQEELKDKKVKILGIPEDFTITEDFIYCNHHHKLT